MPPSARLPITRADSPAAEPGGAGPLPIKMPRRASDGVWAKAISKISGIERRLSVHTPGERDKSSCANPLMQGMGQKAPSRMLPCPRTVPGQAHKKENPRRYRLPASGTGSSVLFRFGQPVLPVRRGRFSPPTFLHNRTIPFPRAYVPWERGSLFYMPGRPGTEVRVRCSSWPCPDTCRRLPRRTDNCPTHWSW